LMSCREEEYARLIKPCPGVSRRRFLGLSGLAALGIAAGRIPGSTGSKDASSRQEAEPAGFGPLIKDPGGILDLPRGFSYRIISRAGHTMSDGFKVPGHADGMAAFPGPGGKTIVLRNHEIWPDFPPEYGAFGAGNVLLRRVRRSLLYDWMRGGTNCLGAVTTLVFGTRTQKLESQFLTLCGTLANCSGGATPWGTWLSCEEWFQNPGLQYSKRHGYVFEVKAASEPGIQKPVPLKGMGRFVHEGVAVDPATGICYMTEDQNDALFYRFLPVRPQKPAEGGRLQCLAVRDRPGLDTRNWQANLFPAGSSAQVEWIDLDDVDGKNDDLRVRGFEKGGARFAHGEGIAFGAGAVHFDSTFGGRTKTGQIWRYFPSPAEGTPQEPSEPGRLELFLQPDDARVLFNPDQMALSPWGDLLICEDNSQRFHLLGITPQGKSYLLARNVKDDSELAGVCFSPDRSTMFLNLQDAGLTLAVTGPWKTPSG